MWWKQNHGSLPPGGRKLEEPRVERGKGKPLSWVCHFLRHFQSPSLSVHVCEVSRLDWVSPRCVSNTDISLIPTQCELLASSLKPAQKVIVPLFQSPAGQKGFVYRHCHLPGLFLKLLICAPKEYNLDIWVPLLLVWNVAVLIVKNERQSRRQQRAPVGFPKNECLWEKEREYLEHVLHETHCCMHCICVIPQKSIFKEITSLEDGNQEVSSAESSCQSIVR